MKYLKMLAVAAALAGVSNLAHATLAVQLSQNGSTATCQDNAACDSNPLVGIVNFTTIYGTVSVSGIGSGAPVLPALNLDLTWNLTAPAGSPAATYTIAVSQNDLAVTYPIQFHGLAAGTQTNGATTAYANFADGGNVLFAHTQDFCDGGSTTANPVNLACTSVVFASGAPVVSITSQITITANAGQTSATGDALLTRVPEPGTVALLGIALAGLGFVTRRKQA